MNIYRVGKTNKESAQTIVTRRHDTAGRSVIWTDGSCEPNPGPGGWAVVIDGGPEYSGADPATTNNRMEMMAILEAIERTTGPVIIRTDSQLCVLCFTGRWGKKTNNDLWRRMERATNAREVLVEWWRGHCGTAGNERADELAGEARQSLRTAEQKHLAAIARHG